MRKVKNGPATAAALMTLRLRTTARRRYKVLISRVEVVAQEKLTCKQGNVLLDSSEV